MKNNYKMLLAVVFITLLMSFKASEGIAAPVPTPVGVWDLSGADSGNNLWIASLVLIHGKNNAIVGFADWSSNRGFGGREYMAGTYNSTTRQIKFHGIRTKYPHGIVRGSYMATLSADNNNLLNGKWSDLDPTLPGKWVAKRIILK